MQRRCHMASLWGGLSGDSSGLDDGISDVGDGDIDAGGDGDVDAGRDSGRSGCALGWWQAMLNFMAVDVV